MELAVLAVKGRAGEEGEPVLAGEGGTHEALWLIRWEAEEDLLEHLVWQRRRCHGR